MLKISIVIVALIAAAAPVAAAADCYKDGTPVPEGTRAGPMVCENGQWVFRP